MSNDVLQAAMTTWAVKDIPGRLQAAQVAKPLNCTTDDVAVLVGGGNLRPLGRPKPNAVKYFSTIELITLLADREWLDEATKTIGLYWRRKNARRQGLTPGIEAKDDDFGTTGRGKKPSTKSSTPELKACAERGNADSCGVVSKGLEPFGLSVF
jgi:hypothetical protein